MLRISPELYAFLSDEERHLIRDSLELLTWLKTTPKPPEVHDMAFIIFPIAKAYEGFLKDFFYKIGLISQRTYEGRHFRVGRSFNPDLSTHLRNEEWIYDDAEKVCNREITREMWQVWLDARNHLFHYFPTERYLITIPEAEELCSRIITVMEDCLKCKLNFDKKPEKPHDFFP